MIQEQLFRQRVVRYLEISIRRKGFVGSYRSSSSTASTSSGKHSDVDEEWTSLTLRYPLTHLQTGINIYLCGVHHHSPSSLDRVRRVIQKVKPKALCLEVDQKRWNTLGFDSYLLNESGEPGLDLRLLKGVQTVDSSNPSYLNDEDNSNSPATDSDYGAEMPLAYHLALRNYAKCVTRLIDQHPNTLSHPSSRAILSSLIKKYSLKPSFVRPNLISRGLFKLLLFSSFGSRAISIEREIGEDKAGVDDWKLYLRIWKTFHPRDWFWWVEARNAGMCEGITEAVRDLGYYYGRLEEGANAAAQKGTNDFQSENTNSNGEMNIVVVCGKSHVFGLYELLVTTLVPHRFKLAPRNFVPELRSDILPNAPDAMFKYGPQSMPGPQVSIIAGTGVEPRMRQALPVDDKPNRRPPPPPPPRPPPSRAAKQRTGITYID
ncbi:hypothetical protein BC832DRAFT_545825 [Gaertneriomyces semiglobifer]|nr:hypothetical protein BC832DRAFT_545825 [Gaertneriomyces semiglobifer]